MVRIRETVWRALEAPEDRSDDECMLNGPWLVMGLSSNRRLKEVGMLALA